MSGTLIVSGMGAALFLAVAVFAGNGDYQLHGAVFGDNPAPAIGALVHGRLAAMTSLQPLMGLTSIIWRAPWAALGTLLGANDRIAYELGCGACLLPAAGLIGWLVGRTVSPRDRAAIAAAAVLIAVGPATVQGLQVGHPEETLSAVLAVGAVLCASAGRRGWSAVLLGLAIGSKPWALLALPCVLLASERGRAALMARTVLVALPVTILLPLCDPTAFARAGRSVGGVSYSGPMSVWWPFGPHLPGARLSASVHGLPFGLDRSEASAAAILLGVAAIGAYGAWTRRRSGSRVDPFALLALLGLVRCIADPAPLAYYFSALVIPLAVWEAAILKRLPIVTAMACAALAVAAGGFVGDHAGPLVAGAAHDAVWLAGCAALGCYLTGHVWSPAIAGTGLDHDRPLVLPATTAGR